MEVNSNKRTLSDDTFAPILITVFDRHEHFERSLNALSQCSSADKTKVYIASDFSENPVLNNKIQAVRSFSKKFKGFKSITIFERNKNFGAVNNYFDALEKVFEKHDRLIFLQDDIVVGRGFLNYMNNGLKRYENSRQVISICAYLPLILENISDTPFFLKRRVAYGIGMWRHKEQRLNELIGPDLARSTLSNFKDFLKVSKASPHIIRSLPFIASGDFRAGDYEMAAVMELNGLLALYPQTCIVSNNGLDGSGLHSGFQPDLQAHAYSDIDIDYDFVIEEAEFTAAAEKLTIYLSFWGHKLLNLFIYFGWNNIPGFYALLRTAKRVYTLIKKSIIKSRMC